ncbi:hypothetical protein ANT2_2044 [plant metagenome]|uniref:Uncharacterized protein n=1 Tax=plant metagenome TaxID=1297885 RepID=A0A484SAC5_9ZZZZ
MAGGIQASLRGGQAGKSEVVQVHVAIALCRIGGVSVACPGKNGPQAINGKDSDLFSVRPYQK